jgi:hypothetical protein
LKLNRNQQFSLSERFRSLNDRSKIFFLNQRLVGAFKCPQSFLPEHLITRRRFKRISQRISKD